MNDLLSSHGWTGKKCGCAVPKWTWSNGSYPNIQIMTYPKRGTFRVNTLMNFTAGSGRVKQKWTESKRGVQSELENYLNTL